MITTTQNSTSLTELLMHLIRMPTVTSDHATNRAALDWVQEQLHGLPLSFRTVTDAGVTSLIATTPAVKNPKKPKLWLAGHIDVVPGTPAEFKPVIKDGKLYGRGVFDMKYGLAIYIHLLRSLGEDLADYNIGLMIVSDEEVGGHHGAGHLASLGYTSETMLMPECGTSWSLETGGKAVSWWRAVATGLSGHASRPWLGNNAISRLTKFLADVEQDFPSEPCGDERHLHDSINFGTIKGGAATNQIAGLAEATIDIRLMPTTRVADIQKRLEEAAAAVPGVSIERLIYDPAYSIPADGPARLFEQLTGEITGREVGRTFAHASSDSRFFARQGVHVITVPTTGAGQHSPKEWIDLADLDKYYEIVQSFVSQYAGPS
jgi:succinyl-diaminopimelate desuccinylase